MPTVHPIPIHPAALAMPELSAAEFEVLKADIDAHGLQCPITIYDGKVIDGRHRYRALLALGAEDNDTYYEELCLEGNISEDQSPEEWVWSVNGLRRHLTQSQRAAIAWELLGAAAIERAKTRQRKGPRVAQNCATLNARSSQEIARIAGVSARLVDMAKVVHEWTPDVFSTVKCGAVALSEAYDTAKQERDRTHEKFGVPLPEEPVGGAEADEDHEALEADDSPDAPEQQTNNKSVVEPTKPVVAAAKSEPKRIEADQTPPKPTKASTAPVTADRDQPSGISGELDGEPFTERPMPAAEAAIWVLQHPARLTILLDVIARIEDLYLIPLLDGINGRLGVDGRDEP